jgi:hypothetical protein
MYLKNTREGFGIIDFVGIKHETGKRWEGKAWAIYSAKKGEEDVKGLRIDCTFNKRHFFSCIPLVLGKDIEMEGPDVFNEGYDLLT